MSKLYSDEVKEVVYKKKRKILGVKCDICDGIVKHNSESNRYFDVMTGHRDWGNDSCESIEHQDICPKCIAGFVSEYLSDCSDTGYINIEIEVVWNNDWDWE